MKCKIQSYNNKYQEHIAYSYGYKLQCFDGKFSKPFKTYLGEDAVYNFINNMIEESKNCSEVAKKIAKEDNEDRTSSSNCWICDNDYVDNDVKVSKSTNKYLKSYDPKQETKHITY